MLKEERYQQIVDWVNLKGAVTVEELCEKFAISQSTVSRDLQILSQAGKLVKTHGGAVSNSTGLAIEPSVSQRKTQFTKEKQRIAAKAVEYINSGETIIMDSGTTTFWMVNHLHDFVNLSVWTNDMYIAFELLSQDEVEVIMLGGKLRKKYYNTMGVLTNQILNNVHVDKLFIGVDAINVDGGLMVYSPEEAELKRQMIQTAKETIVLCDHSKFEKMALMSFCPIDQVQKIITGKETDPKMVSMISKMNIEMDLV